MIPTLQLGAVGRRRHVGGYNAETVAWYTGIASAGSSVTTQEKGWADALILHTPTWVNYFLPFLGSNIIAHRMPLRDYLARGISGNSGFVDADCSNSGGLNNSAGAAKILNTFILPHTLGAGNSGGMFIYIRSWTNGSAVEPCGAYSSGGGVQRWVLDLRSSLEAFRFSDVSTAVPQTAIAASPMLYHGRAASSTDRKLCKNGGTPINNTTSKALTTCDQQIRVGGCIDNSGGLTYTKGVYACFGTTDGTETDADMAAWKTTLDTYLIAPTGR